MGKGSHVRGSVPLSRGRNLRSIDAMGDSPPKPQSDRLERFLSWWTVPVLTPARIGFAFAVAVLTDALQLMLGPLGSILVDQGLDVLAMILTCRALGFHMLLLPTFVIEFIPIADMLPTWTACTAAVVMLRKRAQTPPSPSPPKIAKVTSVSSPDDSAPPPVLPAP
jgi:hypothetical protein